MKKQNRQVVTEAWQNSQKTLEEEVIEAEMHLRIALERLSQTEGKIKIIDREEAEKQIFNQLESKLSNGVTAEKSLPEEKFLEIQEELYKKEEELQEVILHLGKKVKENAMLQELLEQQKEFILAEQKDNEQKTEQIARLKFELDKISQREQLLQKQLAQQSCQ